MTIMTVLAVFRSRAQSLAFAERLKSYGIPAEMAPAPKEAKIGCGLCVSFDGRFFPRVKAVARLGRYSTFKGFYRVDYLHGVQTLFPIY